MRSDNRRFWTIFSIQSIIYYVFTLGSQVPHCSLFFSTYFSPLFFYHQFKPFLHEAICGALLIWVLLLCVWWLPLDTSTQAKYNTEECRAELTACLGMSRLHWMALVSYFCSQLLLLTIRIVDLLLTGSGSGVYCTANSRNIQASFKWLCQKISLLYCIIHV